MLILVIKIGLALRDKSEILFWLTFPVLVVAGGLAVRVALQEQYF